jgi:UDP-N-acetylmuramate--alanine ligase
VVAVSLHLDYWGTEEAYHAAFAEFVGTLDPSGFLVVCTDDPGAASLVDVARSRDLAVVTVGEQARCDVRATRLAFEGSASSFEVSDHGVPLGRVMLQVPGRHYVLDALAALALGLRLGLPFDELRTGLEAFTGTGRRMERKGEAGGVRVYDSYAHHPVEIAGDLQAARALAGDGRLVVAYQPHLVSRTRIFGAAMGAALGVADEVVVLDVYVAREDPDPGVTGRLVADAVPLPAEHVHFLADLEAAPGELLRLARPGDLVLTLGAGSVTEVGPLLLDLLENS